ncbi:hypothetical protein [Streptomyces sp. NPDC059398]|uniref:hypothetical protein n=1 Tax=Streptomyces sp. NPDC059398 TaxID=3346820 RepID=UPI0036AB449F
MSRFSRRYGAHPVHLLVMACCFTVAGYAAVELLRERPVVVAVWFIGAALLHDLVLLPVYSAADRTAQAALPPRGRRPVWRGGAEGSAGAGAEHPVGHGGATRVGAERPEQRGGATRVAGVGTRAAGTRWILYLRAPVALSALLLLVWFPLILRRSAPYHQDTGLSDRVYLDRWLLITAGLFAASALAALATAARRRRRARRPASG